jgi:hypothetical protein
MKKHGDLDAACPTGTCASTQRADVDSYETFGLVSTIGFISGGELAATGVVLVLTAPSSRGRGDAATWAPFVGPGGAGIRGSF